ncbi:acyltransferase [Macrococcus brunensis]|uniref:acyltransferase n=1 Tax=Macrococcus brunensis TaxID=198483 RepID=UPI001EEF9447|nr:acyltransferase [Macrococcus brunensis]ULG72698.1 acyltransferase [Macrococcus brunensis]
MKPNIFNLLRKIGLVFSIFPKNLRMFFYEIFSWSESKLFIAIRYMIVSSVCKSIGDNVYIGKFVTLKNLNDIVIGNNVSIHNYCYIDGIGKISIGDNVSIAHNSTILSSSHRWDYIDIPIKYNEIVFKPVIIHNDVWIGAGVRILYGTELKSRSIVAANAVVNKDVANNTIVGGVPIKILKEI